MELKPHKFAALLPMMSEPEYQSLKASVVAVKRFTDDAVEYQGQLLDGRNRQRVERETGVKLKIVKLSSIIPHPTDADALNYVYGKANHRNMSDSQKAAAAVNFLPHFESLGKSRMTQGGVEPVPQGVRDCKLFPGCTRKEAKKRLDDTSRPGVFNLYASFVLKDKKAKDGGGRSFAMMVAQLLNVLYPPDSAPATNGKSRDFAGSLFGVSGRYVQDAKLVFEQDPKLFQQVFDGKIPVSQAKREVQRRAKAKSHKAKSAAAFSNTLPEGFWNVVVGDCVEVLKRSPAGTIRLIATDPPYNEGIDYGRGAKADSMSAARYAAFCDAWVEQCARQLTPDGSMFIMNSARNQQLMMDLCIKHKLHWRNTIAWVETFGNYTAGNFTSCWRPIVYFTKSPNKFVWHGDQIMIPSDRQTKYADKRANPAGKVPGNVWTEFPRLVDNAKERIPGFPTQIPVALMERIVLAASDPGDRVADPFNGSGTTGEAAIRHGRRYAGVELIEANAHAARERLKRVAAERKG
ncbi:MAG: DNA methyltransferase [Tepidisphaeraceae bacterium]